MTDKTEKDISLACINEWKCELDFLVNRRQKMEVCLKELWERSDLLVEQIEQERRKHENP